jgi:hypothetical protein
LGDGPDRGGTLPPRWRHACWVFVTAGVLLLAFPAEKNCDILGTFNMNVLSKSFCFLLF